MSTSTYYFSGVARWAKVREPDEKYDNYQIVLYMDTPSFDRFKESGAQLKVKEDEHGRYVCFKRKVTDWEGKPLGPPEILIKQGDKYEKTPKDLLIGNGSLVTARVDVYDTRNGKGSRLISVGIDSLIEYSKNTPENVFDPTSQLGMSFR